MDGPLSSTRTPGSGRHHRSFHRGGGGGNRRYDRNRPRSNRYRPYPPRGGSGRTTTGGRGRHNPGNRFKADSQTEKSIDPQAAMLKQLSSMVAKMGDWGSVAASSTVRTHEEIVMGIGMNVRDLSRVLCSPKTAAQFLKFGKDKGRMEEEVEGEDDDEEEGVLVDMEEEAGPLATLVVSCAYALPMQTCSYAALSVAVEKGVVSSLEEGGEDYRGFAERCVKIACCRVEKDLDYLLLERREQLVVSADLHADVFCRVKLLFRYFAMLAKTGIVKGAAEGEDEENGNGEGMSFCGVLRRLTDAAVKASSLASHATSNLDANRLSTCAAILALLVLSTVPYAKSFIPREKLDSMLDSIEQSVLNSYKSSYEPGKGISALLLKEEQYEIGQEEEEEEEEEDEEENESDEGPPCCDTLQDLMRTNRRLLQNNDSTKFTLLEDAPWDHIDESDSPTKPLLPSPLLLNIECSSVTTILSSDDNLSTKCKFLIPSPYPALEGIIYGRFPIFDPQPDEDEDEEEEEGDDEKGPQSQYVQNFSLPDRYFLNESIRDILLCHRPRVTTSGLERGSCREVAEQLWSLSHLFVFPQQNDDTTTTTTTGIEFGIIESVLGLIAQSSDKFSLLSHAYLSRVLVELTKLHPQSVPQALAVGVGLVFAEIVPSMVPQARAAWADWFGYHLTNTDFQWPRSYWDHWDEYANATGRNSRKEVLQRALVVMASYSSRLVVQKECLPEGNSFVVFLVEDEATREDMPVEKELRERMWEHKDDCETLSSWLCGDEASESMLGAADGKETKWWRSLSVLRSILSPAKKQPAEQNDMEEDDTEERPANSDIEEDVLQIILGAIKRYAPVLKTVALEDAKGPNGEVDDASRLETEIALLNEIDALIPLSSDTCFIAEAVLESMQKHEVIQPRSIFQWILGDYEPNGSSQTVSSRWYHIASICARTSIVTSISVKSESNDAIMAVTEHENDDTNSAANSITVLVRAVVDDVSPLLRYAAERVCALSQAADDHPPKGKKLSPTEVDLTEGMKYVMRSVQSYCCSYLQQYYGCSGASAAAAAVQSEKPLDLETLLSESLGGKRLASICREVAEEKQEGLVNGMIQSLERIGNLSL